MRGAVDGFRDAKSVAGQSKTPAGSLRGQNLPDWQALRVSGQKVPAIAAFSLARR